MEYVEMDKRMKEGTEQYVWLASFSGYGQRYSFLRVRFNKTKFHRFPPFYFRFFSDCFSGWVYSPQNEDNNE